MAGCIWAATALPMWSLRCGPIWRRWARAGQTARAWARCRKGMRGGHAEDSDSRGAALWQYRKMVVAGLGCGLGHRKIPATMDGCEHSLGRAGLFFGPEQRRTGLDP